MKPKTISIKFYIDQELIDFVKEFLISRNINPSSKNIDKLIRQQTYFGGEGFLIEHNLDELFEFNKVIL